MAFLMLVIKDFLLETKQKRLSRMAQRSIGV